MHAVRTDTTLAQTWRLSLKILSFFFKVMLYKFSLICLHIFFLQRGLEINALGFSGLWAVLRLCDSAGAVPTQP